MCQKCSGSRCFSPIEYLQLLRRNSKIFIKKIVDVNNEIHEFIHNNNIRTFNNEVFGDELTVACKIFCYLRQIAKIPPSREMPPPRETPPSLIVRRKKGQVQKIPANSNNFLSL